MIGIGRVIEVVPDSALPDLLPSAVAALLMACRDYAADRRGDVGSWVREASGQIMAWIVGRQDSTKLLGKQQGSVIKHGSIAH